MRRALPGLLLIIACIPVLLALVKPGFYKTHDGEFNLVRLMHFDQELKRGQFPVRWSYDLNYKLGSPVFSFFYPLSYYLSALIHNFGPDYGSSLKILVALTTVGAVITIYTWLRGHFKPYSAFFGALLYLYVPYRLLTMYVTGSFGVLLSLLFLPLLFLSVDKIILGNRRYWWLLPVSILGLLTAHNVTALILLPLSAGYSLLIMVLAKPKNSVAVNVLCGWAIGLGLAAFFWLPALSETKYVFLSQGAVVNFRDHFPSLRQLIYSKWDYFYSVSGRNDGMSFQLGLSGWMVAGLTGLVLTLRLITKRRLSKETILGLFFLGVFVVSILMMLPLSVFVWEKITVLSQIQFPWRVLAATMVAIPFMGALLAERKLGKILMVLIMAILLWNNRNYLRTWEMIRYSDDSYQIRDGFYYGSTDIAWETRPIWATEKPIWIAKEIVVPDKSIEISAETSQNPNNLVIAAVSTKSARLVINRFYYPIWRVKIDGRETTITPTVPGGLMAIELPAGKHKITVSQTRTEMERLADGISLLSLCGLVIFTLRRRK